MNQPAKLRSGAHSVFVLHAHMVFVPKYRRKVITERVFATLRTSWTQVCARHDAVLTQCNVEPDHAHLLISYSPRIALSILAQQLKANSARAVRLQAFPEVVRLLRGDAFWSASYFVTSCGGAPLEAIRRYVEQQEGPAATPSPGPLPPRTPIAIPVRGLRGSFSQHKGS